MEMVVGCDVGKTRIDVVVLGDGEKRVEVANDARSIERFAKKLPAGSLVGMESTGTFHELLADALVAAGHRVFVINPRWIHAYARGIGMRGKTDRTDAMVIARFVAAEHRRLHPYRPPTAEERELRGLLQRRIALAKIATAAAQSLGEEAGAVLQQIKLMRKALEKRIRELLAGHEPWHSLYRRLLQMPGVGALTAAQLVACLTRTPFASADAFIAHTGTDPRPNDSGQKRGRRRISHHGNAALRSLLYMAAMAASRQAPWRAYYQAQRLKGLSSTAAYVIVARKIARIAFSLFRTGQEYDAARMPGVVPT